MMIAHKSDGVVRRLAAMNTLVDEFPRCSALTGLMDDNGVEMECGRMLAEVATKPWRIKCGRCGHINEG